MPRQAHPPTAMLSEILHVKIVTILPSSLKALLALLSARPAQPTPEQI